MPQVRWPARNMQLRGGEGGPIPGLTSTADGIYDPTNGTISSGSIYR